MTCLKIKLSNYHNPTTTPLYGLFLKKKTQGNKKWRIVLDFRKLNEKTISDSFPLPNIHGILDQLGNAQCFAVFDLASRLHQIKVSPQFSQNSVFNPLWSSRI